MPSGYPDSLLYVSTLPPLLEWTPVSPPAPVSLRGLYATITTLKAQRHSEALWEAFGGHDEIWTWTADGPYAGSAELRTALEQKQAAVGSVYLAIAPATTGRAAGYASFTHMEPMHGSVEVGNICLGPSLQNTTAATEAMYLMARHVFEDLGYRRYEWKCDALNEPSRRAALRLGFTFEGIFRHHMVVKGRNRDTAWFSMLDSEWPDRKAAFLAWLAPANFDADGQQRFKLGEAPYLLPDSEPISSPE